jgi:hypothetical protein
MAKAYAEARKEHGSGQLLDDIVSEKPEVDRTRFQSVEDLRSALLQHIRDAVSLLAEKATPEELDEYRRFLASVASRVAEAHREGFLGMSGERVSEAEERALTEIAEAAGTSTPDEG